MSDQEEDTNAEEYQIQPKKIRKNGKRKIQSTNKEEKEKQEVLFEEKKDEHEDDDLLVENIDDYLIQYKLQNQEKYRKLQKLIDEPVTFTAETSKCKYCGNYSLITMEKQARSADEKQDVFATCSNEECSQKRTQKLG
jgi:DNA-directed RNA polymerase subunit M/transcription elongation factor TFIIS